MTPRYTATHANRKIASGVIVGELVVRQAHHERVSPRPLVLSSPKDERARSNQRAPPTGAAGAARLSASVPDRVHDRSREGAGGHAGRGFGAQPPTNGRGREPDGGRRRWQSRCRQDMWRRTLVLRSASQG